MHRIPIRQSGWTLTELLMVGAIAAVVGAIAVPGYSGYMDKARSATAEGDILGLQNRIEQYVLGRPDQKFPDTLDDIGGSPLDPWGNPYQYLNIANEGKGKGKLRKDKNLVPINSDYDLYSMGPDGKSKAPLTAKASRDDIVRANNGKYIGIAEDY